ncbi:hypothetical protein M413DRAFT_443595 [Hebeloma cylindrosporum]|uniref:NACHT domain-containing protein n=1 Tax=Hebeloma cylindrosporum TaxID=76867 RepID=A0A0C2YRP4_HEBCY|nr:hypothetical protein M413DRAFT_443595 [Hebeloma cylindrosporum h7]
MAFFSDARDFTISGGTFTSNLHRAEGEKGRELLASRVAQGALHNAAERYDPPKCHPRTRKAILKRIMEWVDSPEGQAFLWIYGPAGSGKSAIAQTIAELCFKANKLAASFFFSRNAAARNNELLLISTLVYQLAHSFPEIRKIVESRIEHDPIVLSLSLEAQIEALLIEPLNRVLHTARAEGDEENFHSRPRLIILDGLDECGDGDTQRYVLDVLSRAVSSISFPIIFLITSRPEQVIRNSFNYISMSASTTRIPLDDAHEPDADIRIVIESKCEEIRETHPARASLPSPWPSYDEIEQLVAKSSGQFIYASTVLKFLESPRHRPQDRLNIIFGISAAENATPFAELDALYSQIFSTVIDIEKLRDVLSVILLTAHIPKTQTAIEEFLSYSSGTVDILFSDLPSVIALPSLEEPDSQIQILHASLTDFLYDRSRSGNMFIDVEAAHAFIAIRLMHRFNQPLPQNLEDEDNPLKVSRLYDRLMFPKHCFSAGSSPELLDDLYVFDLADYLGWFRSSDSILVQRSLSLSLNSSNKAKSDPRIQRDIMEDTGLHVPGLQGSIHGSSKDGTLSVSLIDRTGAYIRLANLDPEIRVTTKDIAMSETYITSVRSSADIPKFLLWLREKRTANHTSDLFHHHLSAIDTWIRKQLEIPVNQNFRPSFLESTDSHRFNLKRRAQKLFDILKDEEQEARLSSDAVFLALLVDQLGNNLIGSITLGLPWDHTNDPTYYTLFHDFLTDPTRAGPHFFDDDKFARLTKSILDFIIQGGIHDETVIFYPDPLRRVLSEDALRELSTVDMSSPGPGEIFQDCGVLTIVPYMLERAAKTRELEAILLNHPFKSDDVDDVLHSWKQKCAEAAEAYLEKCKEQRDLDAQAIAETCTVQPEIRHIKSRNYPSFGIVTLLVAVMVSYIAGYFSANRKDIFG